MISACTFSYRQSPGSPKNVPVSNLTDDKMGKGRNISIAQCPNSQPGKSISAKPKKHVVSFENKKVQQSQDKPYQPGPQQPVPTQPPRPGPQQPVLTQPPRPGPQQPVPTQPPRPGLQQPVPTQPPRPGPQQPVPTQPPRPGPQQPVPTQPPRPGPQQLVSTQPPRPGPQQPVPTKQHQDKQSYKPALQKSVFPQKKPEQAVKYHSRRVGLDKNSMHKPAYSQLFDSEDFPVSVHV